MGLGRGKLLSRPNALQEISVFRDEAVHYLKNNRHEFKLDRNMNFNLTNFKVFYNKYRLQMKIRSKMKTDCFVVDDDTHLILVTLLKEEVQTGSFLQSAELFKH